MGKESAQRDAAAARGLSTVRGNLIFYTEPQDRSFEHKTPRMNAPASKDASSLGRRWDD